jgi:hypothetical protein
MAKQADSPDDKAGKPRLRWKRWLFGILFTPVLLFIIYMVIVLNFSFSNGERAGYVQKFSNQGFIIKTWEGELAMVNMPGAMSEKFYFSVRDDAVAGKINASLGKRVVLIYEHHVGIPTNWWGETSYFVTDVRVISE